ncbi:MAG: RND transporter [Gammaproteobacteria bacterium]|nr:RND transporter [Gammaproteobacteria bacterium]
MKWLDNLPLAPLAAVAILMAVLPFNATPHLFEKLAMFVDGSLQRPIDIFDLFMHGTPAVLLVVRLFRQFILDKKEADKK